MSEAKPNEHVWQNDNNDQPESDLQLVVTSAQDKDLGHITMTAAEDEAANDDHYESCKSSVY